MARSDEEASRTSEHRPDDGRRAAGSRGGEDARDPDERLLGIGEFARRSLLSPKALRLYDDLGLLAPASVDADTGYRHYDVAQLERARLVALLRRIAMPLTEIRTIVDLEPRAAAARVADYWRGVEDDHAGRRDLAALLIDSLNGREIAMDVAARRLPERRLLCLKRHVTSQEAVWALGKEAIAIFRERPLPAVPGVEGASFLVYYAEVSADSDGPVEWCRPVPAEQAEETAARYPELTLRTEPEHDEAYVSLGRALEVNESQWPIIAESLRAWTATQRRPPSELGPRVTYHWPPPPYTPESQPDIDFSLPLR